jgi:hypothetical protein
MYFRVVRGIEYIRCTVSSDNGLSEIIIMCDLNYLSETKRKLALRFHFCKILIYAQA